MIHAVRAAPSFPPLCDEHFHPTHELGSVGFFELFLARERKWGASTQPFLLHLLRSSFTDAPALVETLADHVQRLSSAAHPNLIHPLFHGAEKDSLFFVTEYVPGPSLSGLLERSKDRNFPRLPEPIAIYLAQEICAGVLAAYQATGRALPHRNLTASDILLTTDGRARVTNFALLPEPVSSEAHVPPERQNGQTPDERSDVFAMGVLLYRFFCGRYPWFGSPNEAMRQKFAAECTRPKAITPSLSDELESIVLDCLRPTHEARCPSISELKSRLSTLRVGFTPHQSRQMLRSFIERFYREEIVRETRAGERIFAELQIKERASTPSITPVESGKAARSV